MAFINIKKNAPKTANEERQNIAVACNNARNTLILVVAFTFINTLLLIFKANVYFLFSAYIPYFIADLGLMLTGRYPAEFYVGANKDLAVFGDGFFALTIAISMFIIAVYLLCWIFSKKHPTAFLIISLVMFVLDTVLMLLLGGFAISNILDIIFHIWVLYSLFVGVFSCFRLKKLPPPELETSFTEQTVDENFYQQQNDNISE